MANPRAIVDFTDIGAHYTTFKFDGSVVYNRALAGGAAQAGLAVTLTGNGQVGLVADGQHVHGKLIKAEADGFCTIQDGGYATFPGGTGATFTRGRGVVGALNGGNSGYVRGVASATAAEIADGKGEVVDTSVATAIVVDLGQAGAE